PHITWRLLRHWGATQMVEERVPIKAAQQRLGHSRPDILLKFYAHVLDASADTAAESLSGQLSGGEQQRIAIARALITRPAIVLADEPTGNLDTKNSDAVLDMLVRSNRELGQTTLMITHNPEAAAVAGRILYMRDGQMVREEKGAGGRLAAV
ncbi:MAG TPA: ATP-binding cassette domain-containing protein, partial [Terracidiphilus sp.]